MKELQSVETDIPTMKATRISQLISGETVLRVTRCDCFQSFILVYSMLIRKRSGQVSHPQTFPGWGDSDHRGILYCHCKTENAINVKLMGFSITFIIRQFDTFIASNSYM